MSARTICEKIRGGEPAPSKPIWNNKPFARRGLIARLRGMSGNSRKLVTEALLLQQEGQLTAALAKFQLALSAPKMNPTFALALRERSAHIMHEIAQQKLRPDAKKNALGLAADEYTAAAEYAKENISEPQLAVHLYICARDIYTEIGEARAAEKAHNEALSIGGN